MMSSTSVNVLFYFICLHVLPPLLSPSFSASPGENPASAEAPAERGGRRRAPEPPHLRTIPPRIPQLFLTSSSGYKAAAAEPEQKPHSWLSC